MQTMKSLLGGSPVVGMLIAVAPGSAFTHTVEAELTTLLLQDDAALTNADLHVIDTIPSHHPEVTLLGTDPTAERIGHAPVLQFWQEPCGVLGGGLTTIPGDGSPEVIIHMDGGAGLMDTYAPVRLTGPDGGAQALRVTAVFRERGPPVAAETTARLD
jgi:hypothetical protein